MHNYASTLTLLLGVTAGAVLGALSPAAAAFVKPLGEIFLNLIFVMIVPLVFFSMTAAVCKLRGSGMMGKVLIWVLVVFVGMSLIAAATGLVGTAIYPPSTPASTVTLSGPAADVDVSAGVASALVGALTVDDFSLLLSKEHMLALIIFALLFGCAVSAAGEKGRPVEEFVFSGNEVMMKMVGIVMKAAPLGLGCYFAATIATVGSALLGGYLRAFILFLGITVLFFFGINSLYAALAGRLRSYWTHIWEPAATAVATASSAASIPSAIAACKRMGVSDSVAESVIPLGTNIHKDGSVIGAVLKIVFLMMLTGRAFDGPGMILAIVGVALLESLVLSAVPSGGLTGEVFICSVMGFSPEMVGMIVIIGAIIDIPATLLNVNGNVVAALLTDRVKCRWHRP